jgi:outer membrane protein assembly factor BamB
MYTLIMMYEQKKLRNENMNTDRSKSKLSTIALILLLTVSIMIVALPTVQAQDLIMNCDSIAVINQTFDVDLNGPSSQLEGLKYAYKAPGAADFVLTTEFPIDNEPGLPGERYVTDPGGDCDIDVVFDQLGDWQVKWVHPASGAESSPVTVEVVLEITKQSFAYLGAIPNPVGVNQDVLLHVGITEPESRVDRGWKDLTVTVKDPQGGTTTLGPYNTDATGGTGGVFRPTMVGTYELQTIFPKQMKFDGTSMLASTSDVLYLEVQADPVPYYPGHSLPSEYWTRPIDTQLREWYKVAGNWLDDGESPRNLYAPYNEDAPDTAHILWAKPIVIGGLAGGTMGEHGFVEGDAYEGKWQDRIIMAGRLYYTDGGSRGLDLVETHCVDLRTGEELWSKVFLDNRSISFGQTLYWDSFNMHGVYQYLYVDRGSRWYVFDGDTGDWRFTVENVPSGRDIVSDNGERQVLDVDTRNNEMSLWAISGWIAGFSGSSAGSWGNNVEGQVLDADDFGDDAILWTVPIPDDLIGGVDWVLEDRVIGASLSRTEVTLWGISLVPGEEGKFLFQNTWQAPAYWAEGDVTVSGFGGGWMLRHDNVAVLWIKETREYYGFSLETGKNIWGPTEPQYYLDAVDDTPTASRAAAYGNFYSLSLGGITYCYDIQTGDLKWTYEAEDPYQEFLFANNFWGKPMFITDGKIYLGSLQHSPMDPKPRGSPMYCLDAETGDLIWRADGLFRQTRWGGRAIIGDSVIAAMDTYDQRLYAIGKGPSAITVAKPMAAITKGSSITIQGTVMDVSPGTEDPALQLRFPNGLPAISDEDMSEWMIYVYKNFERPADATGVQVKLEAVDPNGGYVDIGTTTSDSYGNYGLAFEPDTEGTYMIIATFFGSGAYYGSTSTTYLTVDPAAAETDLSSLENSVGDMDDSVSNLTTYILAILALVIMAIVIAVYSLLKSQK